MPVILLTLATLSFLLGGVLATRGKIKVEPCGTHDVKPCIGEKNK